MPGSGSLLSQGNVAVGAAATLIVAANANRQAVIVRNLGDSSGVAVYIGNSAVTAITGLPLDSGPVAGKSGDSITIEGSAAIYGIVSAGAQAVRFLEVGD